MSKLFKLWLIHREIGCTILEQTFEPMKKEIDSDLIGGFLTAVLSFSKEISDESIERMVLETIAIQYYITNHYIIAVACSKDMSESGLRTKLEIISDKFNNQYQELMDNFSGNVDIFQDFSHDVESVMEQSTISLRYISKPTEQVERFIEKRKLELEQIHSVLNGYIYKKSSEFMGLVGGTINSIKKKIKNTLNKVQKE